jgi:hypothetical protein
MLAGVMDSILNKVHEQVQRETNKHIVQQEHVKERLEKIDVYAFDPWWAGALATGNPQII